MTNTIILISAIIIPILLITFLILNLSKKKKKRLEYEAHLERERQKEESRVRREKYNDELGSFFERVEKATLAFRSLVSKSKFVSNYEAYLYYKEYEQLYSELPLKSLDLQQHSNIVFDVAFLVCVMI